jgi:hypothetical protein
LLDGDFSGIRLPASLFPSFEGPKHQILFLDKTPIEQADQEEGG